MLHNLRLLLLLFCPLLAHCVHGGAMSAQPGTSSSSMEFRLQNLEAGLMELEQKQQALEAALLERLQALQQEAALLRARLGESAPAQPATQPAPPKPQPAPAASSQAAKASASAKPTPPKKPKPMPQPKPQPKPTASAPQKQASSAATPPAATKPPASLSGKALLQEALQRIKAGKPAQAIALLEKFTSENPGHTLAPEAFYWLGEAHYHTGGYDEAILAYKDVAGRFPNHAKAPEAMLKIGYAYEKLQDPNNARFYLQALVDEYPKSTSATLARERIAQLGR